MRRLQQSSAFASVCSKPAGTSQSKRKRSAKQDQPNSRCPRRRADWLYQREYKETKPESDTVQLLFERYALRMKKLHDEIQTFVQLQLSQIFFNAENRNLPTVPVTQLPPVPSPHATSSQTGPYHPLGEIQHEQFMPLQTPESNIQTESSTSEILSTAIQLTFQ